MSKVFIIAEAGVNHNGKVDTAKKMVLAASEARADAIKFQTFKAEYGISKFAQKAEYQKNTTGKNESQLNMAKKLELDADAHVEIMSFCEEKNIMFLSSPFDLVSIDLLDKMGLRIFKVPSGEITNLPYLRKIGGLKKKLILSTGMADLREVGRALNILTKAGTKKENITVMHCNTEYPTPYKDVNLRAMIAIRDRFKVSVGYSDHTLGAEIPVAAVALGASVIEKHFTLDKRMPGPDHRASMEPFEFREMVKSIRNIESALGNGVKKPSLSELKNKPIARKSIVAAVDIEKGEIFNENNIAVKRPGTGISPMEWDRIIGKTAKKNFKEDEMIRL